MTVGQLREALKFFPDDLPVGIYMPTDPTVEKSISEAVEIQQISLKDDKTFQAVIIV